MSWPTWSLPALGLLAALVIINILFLIGWIQARRTHPNRDKPTLGDIVIGFVTDFFDALGIGSFAPTTALFKLRGRPADELIPGTLNIGHNASAFVETAIFVTVVAVDPILLVAMVGSATVGAWVGAGTVSRLPRRAIQLFMGAALLIAAGFFVVAILGEHPEGGASMSLDGWRFYVAVGVNFILGALMSVGIGAYAPCMVLLALLGLNPLGAYPIMMGTCGLVQPAAGLRFFKTGRFAWGPSLGLTMGGVCGVLVAVFIVKTLRIEALRWLVLIVVSYAAISMLRSALRPRPGAAEQTAAARADGL
ncbi:MAG TPA: sulfite exporter TauE/SafE family protein [Steroidobacteraceae bacterium]|nr:sulfite exporter TauE/SafE family protein [Steroidobacteraceae bacterium]